MKPVTVVCSLEEIILQDEHGEEILGIEITCPLCDEHEISPGITDESVRECLSYLRDQCECENILVY